MKNQKSLVQTSAKNEIVVYQPNETLRLEVVVWNESIWMPQQKIAKECVN